MAKNALPNLAPPHANSSHHKEVCDGEDNFCLHPPYPDIYIIYMIYIKISYSYNLIFFVCKNKNILHSLIIICFFSTNNYNFFNTCYIIIIFKNIFFITVSFYLRFHYFSLCFIFISYQYRSYLLRISKRQSTYPKLNISFIYIFFYDLSFSRFSKKKKKKIFIFDQYPSYLIRISKR